MRQAAHKQRLADLGTTMFTLICDLADCPQTPPALRQRAVEILARMTEGN